MRRSKPAVLASFVVALLLGAPLVGRADEIVLTNGDRITGSVRSLTDSKLVVNTEYAGDIKIDLSKIASVQTDAEMTLVLQDDGRLYGKLTGDGKRLQIDSETAAPQIVERDRIAELHRGRVTGEEWSTSGRVTLGASDSEGNTNVRRANLDAELITRNYRNRITLGGRGNYATDEDRETESNALVYGKYDRFLSRKWYVYASTSFENDKFRDIYLRSTVGVGTGYQIYESKLTNLQVEAGLEYVNTNYDTAPTEDYPGLRLATRYDRWLWEDVTQFFFDGSVTMSLEAYEDAFARVQTGLRFPLRNGFLASLQLNVDWDGNPAPDRESIDRTLILGLGYKW